jgi:prophage regulatory protein
MRYVTRQQLREEFGIPYSKAQLARLEKAGEFPRRVRLSANRVAWVEGEIVAWCAARNQAREAA